ncbi:MAG: flavin reductase [Defluviitaleaceae bacterium]|nr:flavin reductase [Defluviitaleaceae bacterium]
MDKAALFKIGYGLYVLTANDGNKDTGCIINTLLQVTEDPLVGVITVSKSNYTHDVIARTNKFNISLLTTEVPFEIFKRFGYQSGRDVDKFADFNGFSRSGNGVAYLSEHTNSYISFQVTQTIDFGTHTMFRADITNAEVFSKAESVTYSYYQQHIKPKPQSTQKKGYRCNICNYELEGETLPQDFICPICKHGANHFVKI